MATSRRLTDPDPKQSLGAESETQSHFADATSQRRDVQPTRAFLLIESAGHLSSAQLRGGVDAVLGRGPVCQIRVDSRSLSREHARFTWSKGRVQVEDLASKNGVLLNGARVQREYVSSGDVLALGDVTVHIHVRGAALEQEASPAQAPLPFDRWRNRLEDEILRARTFKRALSVVALRASESDSNEAFVRLRGAMRAVDSLTRYSPNVWLILLAEAPRQDAEARARMLSGAFKEPVVSSVAVYPEASSSDALIESALDPLKPRAKSPAQAKPASAVIADPAMVRVYETIARVAGAPLTVLVLGETGVGKELVARALHDQSPRAAGPFRALNCGAIAETLIESELFGHERGAFTGADGVRAGAFEQAHQGTLFLDEVGELSPHAQASLLRVLETRRVVRVGGSREVDVDVRIVAATHRDLSMRVQENSFRADLWYRLEGLVLEIPPLRSRPLDLAPLSEHFLTSIAKEMGARRRTLSTQALEALARYAWPGNVRQLRNVLERACIICSGDEIELVDLPVAIASSVEGGDGSEETAGNGLTVQVRAYEGRLIRSVLAKANGNLSEAARQLGIPRRTLAYRIRVLDLE